MKTKEEREKAFRIELACFLEAHGAELEIGDDGAGYGMQTGIATITMPSIYDDEDNLISDFCEFEI